MKNTKIAMFSILIAMTFGEIHKALGMEEWERDIRAIHKVIDSAVLWFDLIDQIKRGEKDIILNYKHSWLGNEEAKVIAQALPYSKIENLQMMFGEIKDEGAIAFAQIFSETLPLKRLNIYGNKIGSDGAKALINKLPSSKITYLDIGNSVYIPYNDGSFNEFLRSFRESNEGFEVHMRENGVTLVINRKK